MAIKQSGSIVIDDTRSIVSANSVMLTGEYTPYSGQGPNIPWTVAGGLVATFNNPNAYGTSAGDRFGSRVEISGNYAIVGAYFEDDAGGVESGKAYIYNVTTGALLRTLDNPNAFSTSGSDQFGSFVAISGDYAIVGTPVEDGVDGANSGKAHIYNVTTGALLWTLNNPNAYALSGGDLFGNSVAISGNYAIVGARGETDTGGTTSGKAYIFNVITGALLNTLDNPNAFSTSPNDNFGFSVGISGNYAIVSAYAEDDAGGGESGKAYIYNVTTGALLFTLDNPNAYDTSAGDRFGISVAVSGNYAIVGANLEDDAGGSASGKAYIYNVTTGALLFTLSNPNAFDTSISDNFGTSVSISGNYAIVGVFNEDDAGGTQSGKAYIYNVTTGALLYTLSNPNAYSTSDNDIFGISVAISDNYAIVGAYFEDDTGGSDSGKAYTFALNTTYRTGKPLTTASDFGYVRKSVRGALKWTLNNPNAYSTSQSDNFGVSAAISGNYAIVGAYFEDENANGFGTDSGVAYVFDISTGSLVYTLRNPNYYSVPESDRFGQRVAISGKYIAVACPLEDSSGGSRGGVVYVFERSTGSLLSTIRPIDPSLTSGTGNDFPEALAICGNLILTANDSGGAAPNNGELCAWNAQTGANVYRIPNPNGTLSSFGFDNGISCDERTNLVVVGCGGFGDGGTAYIFNALTGALLWTLNNPNAYSTGAGDNFGYAVAISGNYAIVGAYSEDDVGGVSSGKAYIYSVTTGALLFTLNNPNAYSTSDSDQFGREVAISGNYAIVGAPNEDDTGGSQSGKAYVFDVLTGTLLYTLNNPNAYGTSASDIFGIKISFSGNYALFASYAEGDVGGTFSGKAYIFSVNDIYKLTNVEEIQLANGMKISADNKLLQQSVPGGALLKTLDNPNAYSTSAGDQFSRSVAISGNYAIVGANLEDDVGGTTSGKAYIYNVTTGTLLWTLNNPNAYDVSQSDQFARSVAISGNYAIVGAWQEDDAGGLSSGKAYIYNVTTGALLWTLNNPNAYSTSEGDLFGKSVAISGNYAIVSAADNSSGTGEDDAGGTSSGKAYIYNVTTGALVWTLNNPNAYDTSAGDVFGASVAISGNYAIVGALGEDDASGAGSGKAYIFNVTTGALLWTLNNPNVYSTSSLDYFAMDVSISGNYAIVGAPEEDETGGAQSGKAYIYNVTTGALVHTLNNTNAYSTSSADYFGSNVAISDNYAIVGAYMEDDGGGADSGKAYIFSVRDLTYLDRLVQMVS